MNGMCLKIMTPLACCKLDVYRLILVIVGRNLAEEASSQRMLYSPPTSHDSASALPGETGSRGIASFECALPTDTQYTFTLSLDYSETTGKEHSFSPRLSLFPLLTNTLPGPSASEVMI